MTAELQRLGIGIAVAVDPMPGAESASIGLYAMVGSRSEPEHLSGLAHLVEHMVFKGAGSRDARHGDQVERAAQRLTRTCQR